MKRLLYILPLLALVVASCEEEVNPVFDTESFTAIFDNNQFAATYNPIDMIQTEDGGYIVLGKRDLSESEFAGIYLMKVDKYGNFVRETEVNPEYVHPIASLVSRNNLIYFICMNELTTQLQIATVSPDGEFLEASTLLVGDITYPSAASFTDNQFIIQGYNHVDKQTIVATVSLDGNVTNQINYSIGIGDTESLDRQISSHFLETGRQLPFAVGKAGSKYYFNGFYDFTFSLLFTDLSQEEPDGGVQGQRESDNSGLSSILPISANKFAISWFNVGRNYFAPAINIASTGTPTSIGDEGFEDVGLPFRELVDNADVRIIKAQVNEKNTLVYASTTLSKQIGLFFYDELTGKFMSSRYLGYSNPFEASDLIQTSDGGLAVCGTTYLAGRFPRICIFKLSKEELATNAKQ
jgi:hypothetical protein